MSNILYIPKQKALDALFKGKGTINKYLNMLEKGMITTEKKIFGIDKIFFQYNPEEVELTFTANWSIKSAPAVYKAPIHYTGNSPVPFNMKLFYIDDYEDELPKGFADLNGLKQWFECFTIPVQPFNRPIVIEISMGDFNRSFIVKQVKIKDEKTYPDFTPQIVSIDLSMLEWWESYTPYSREVMT